MIYTKPEKNITKDNIINRLCESDKRSPDHKLFLEVHMSDEFSKEQFYKRLEKFKECGCDNCFYNRHDMAYSLLKIMDATNTDNIEDLMFKINSIDNN